LRFTVDNSLGRIPIVVKAVDFNVTDLYTFSLSSTIGAPPFAAYPFYLKQKMGLQTFPLAQTRNHGSVLVPKEQLRTFDVIFDCDPNDNGPDTSADPHFGGQLSLETNVGNIPVGGFELEMVDHWLGIPVMHRSRFRQ
jgi:hypothetical protein